MSLDLLDQIRSSCARVAENARHVSLEYDSLRKLAGELSRKHTGPTVLDPAHHFSGSDADTLAFILTLDAINFGSGWFPHLHKPDGLSGYFTISTALTRHFHESGPWMAEALAELDATRCHETFAQPQTSEIEELMLLFARALNHLGRFLLDGYGGRFEGPIEAAAGSAANLVRILGEMPMYQDVARYDDFEVFFYKRAQLTAADLSAAFGARGPGRFADLDRLTLFADNLVPHVLRCAGVLSYDEGLAARIDREDLIEPGSPEEIEIRALGVHAVERLVAEIKAAGGSTTAQELDYRLWSWGQSQTIKSRPRHRTRCTYY